MSKVEEFVTRNGMSEEVKREMLEILNESLLEISHGIMNESKVNKEKVEKISKNNRDEFKKRYKSKKAEEYAEEHGLRLEDFDINEISKKDVEMRVREITKNKKEKVITTSKISSDEESSSKNKKSETKREKVICSGINKKGEACKSIGTIQPEGAKKKYCFRHAEDFRSFECDSDSSDDEEKECEEKECEEKECRPCETNSEKEFSKKNSDDELLEEEYN
jgi:hypothetical protein